MRCAIPPYIRHDHIRFDHIGFDHIRFDHIRLPARSADVTALSQPLV
jgi:hypothetical protein